MVPVIAIIGRSGTGKTTLIERLITHFIQSGCKISTIKHMRHDFDIDRPGKDTHRYREAGAGSSAILNDRYYAVISKHGGMTPADIAERYFSDADLVIVEGDKEGRFPKIEIIGSGGEDPLHRSGIENIVAIVSDAEAHTGLPHFKRDDVGAIADFIKGLIMK